MLESVSERKAGRLAELGVETVLDLITTYPRRYIDRTRQADVSDLKEGDEAAVLATVHIGERPSGPDGARRRRRGGQRRHGPPQGRLLQPTLAGQAAPVRHRGHLLRQGDRVPGRPPIDEPRRRRRGRCHAGPADAAHPPRLPGLGQGRPDVVGDRGVRHRGPRTGRGVRRPAAGRMARPHRPVGPHGRLPGHPRPRVAQCGRAGAPPARLRRALPAATGPGAATAGLRGQRPGAAPRGVAARGHRRGRRHAGGPLPGRPALRAHQGPAPSPGRHRRRHGRAVPHAPPAARRRRLGQDGGGAGRPPRVGAERSPGRPDGADRGAGRAALRRRARPARRPRGPRRHGRGRGAGRAAHQPGQGQGARRRAGGPGLRRGRGRRGDARALDRGGGVRLARRGRDRRAAPLRRGATGDAAGQGHRR